MADTSAHPQWMEFSPNVGGTQVARRALREGLLAIAKLCQAGAGDSAARAVDEIARRQFGWPRAASAALGAALSLAVDLLHQGWVFELRDDDWWIRRGDDHSPEAQRNLRRSQLALRREEQLREPATAAFLRGMERRQLTSRGRYSIFDLMCDGGNLASRLEQRSVALPVEPYLQAVVADHTCAETGLRLQDIWRYFRHTWANAYESVPGRSIQLLVRDRAEVGHPVIGILALGSAAIKVRCRDAYIGWESHVASEVVREDASPRWAKWAVRFLTDKYEEVYRHDLLRDGLVPMHGLSRCSLEQCRALRVESRHCREVHQRNIDTNEFAKGKDASTLADEDWERLANTMLFRSKRSNRLAELVEIAALLGLSGGVREVGARLVNMDGQPSVKAAFCRLLRYARSETVGTEIADLVVCGAVPPYSELLGGKLVAMLAASRDLVRCYRERYANAPSIIASSMAGRAVVRSANLVFLGTTSLYGIRPSQYDRAGYPCDIVGGRPGDRVRFRFLERTEGFGTSQFSNRTQSALERFMEQSVGRRWRANNVFGEGANPRMRALREAVDSLGLKSESILQHGQSKCVYGVSLARNTRDYLLRLDEQPDYLFDCLGSDSHAPRIAEHWFERWARSRASDPAVIAAIRSHSTALPVRHGARVIPPEHEPAEVPLFGDLS